MRRAFNLETQVWEEHSDEPPTALGLLQGVYRDVSQPLSVRIRCAVESLPYENPKLTAIGFGYLTKDDFASALDRAIERSNGVKLIESQAIEVGDGRRWVRPLSAGPQRTMNHE